MRTLRPDKDLVRLLTLSMSLACLLSLWRSLSNCAGDTTWTTISPEFAIESPSEGATLTNFEETFTGTCNSELPFTASIDESVGRIVSSTCTDSQFSVVVGFRAGTGSRTVSISIGETTLTRTITFNKSCPNNFIGIPGNSTLGTSDFCIGKYEAKAETDPGGVDESDGTNGGGGLNGANYRAEIRETGTPWSFITRNNSRTECANIGYELPSNAQWQTMARNAESVSWNWSSGTVGTGTVARGSSSGGSALSADSNDDNACVGMTAANTLDASDPDDDCGGMFHRNRRTHLLSNGELLWDLAGNVSEYVDDAVPGDITSSPDLSGGGNIPFTDTNSCLGAAPCFPTGSDNRTFFAPLGDYDMNHDIGTTIAGAAGAIIRGGNFNAITISGIFTTRLNQNGTLTVAQYGFRCVSNF